MEQHKHTAECQSVPGKCVGTLWGLPVIESELVPDDIVIVVGNMEVQRVPVTVENGLLTCGHIGMGEGTACCYVGCVCGDCALCVPEGGLCECCKDVRRYASSGLGPCKLCDHTVEMCNPAPPTFVVRGGG